MKSKYNSVLNLWVNSWIKLGRIQMFSIVVFGVIVLGEYTAHAVVISRGHRTYFTSDEGGMDYKKIIHLTDAYWGDPKGVYPLEKVHLYKDASQILILGDGEHGDCTEAEHMA